MSGGSLTQRESAHVGQGTTGGGARKGPARGRCGEQGATAALVVEIVSAGDRTWDKLPFYAEHRVEEVVIVDPSQQSATWLGQRDDGECHPVERSSLIDLGPADLVERLDWPN
jgi:hypothetical protein